MAMSGKDMENWLTHPEIVFEHLKRVIHKEHPQWLCSRFLLDPGVNRMSFEGKLLSESPMFETLALAVVVVPDEELEQLFISSSENGFPISI